MLLKWHIFAVYPKGDNVDYSNLFQKSFTTLTTELGTCYTESSLSLFHSHSSCPDQGIKFAIAVRQANAHPLKISFMSQSYNRQCGQSYKRKQL